MKIGIMNIKAARPRTSKLLVGLAAGLLAFSTANAQTADDPTISEFKAMDSDDQVAFLDQALNGLRSELQRLEQRDRVRCMDTWFRSGMFADEAAILFGMEEVSGHRSAQTGIHALVARACGDWRDNAPVPDEPRAVLTEAYERDLSSN